MGKMRDLRTAQREAAAARAALGLPALPVDETWPKAPHGRRFFDRYDRTIVEPVRRKIPGKKRQRRERICPADGPWLSVKVLRMIHLMLFGTSDDPEHEPCSLEQAAIFAGLRTAYARWLVGNSELFRRVYQQEVLSILNGDFAKAFRVRNHLPDAQHWRPGAIGNEPKPRTGEGDARLVPRVRVLGGGP